MTTELQIIKKDGGAYIDSRQVAEAIGKNHKDILRDIRGYVSILEKADERKIAPISFFLESAYKDAYGRDKPCYLITVRGADIIANKLTGEKGVLFTAAYVTKFREMYEREHEHEHEHEQEISELKNQAVTPKLRVFNNAVRNVLTGFTQVRSSPSKVIGFLRGAYLPFKISVDEWGTAKNPILLPKSPAESESTSTQADRTVTP
jgi:Rha family phage regulatory protein